MKFRELTVGEFFRFGGRIHDGEIRRKVSRHNYVWVNGVLPTSRIYIIGDEDRSPWKARGESEVEIVSSEELEYLRIGGAL